MDIPAPEARSTVLCFVVSSLDLKPDGTIVFDPIQHQSAAGVVRIKGICQHFAVTSQHRESVLSNHEPGWFVDDPDGAPVNGQSRKAAIFFFVRGPTKNSPPASSDWPWHFRHCRRFG
jgi:hypothetical protein